MNKIMDKNMISLRSAKNSDLLTTIEAWFNKDYIKNCMGNQKNGCLK